MQPEGAVSITQKHKRSHQDVRLPVMVYIRNSDETYRALVTQRCTDRWAKCPIAISQVNQDRIRRRVRQDQIHLAIAIEVTRTTASERRGVIVGHRHSGFKCPIV